MTDLNEYIVWTAIITPMTAEGVVDYESLEKLLREQDEAGNGITILGSTGEALNIDEQEKRDILEFAIGLDLNVPMMCGVGGINLNTQREWVEYLNTLELDAFLLVMPLYAKPGIQGQIDWFNALMDVADRPCMIYNVPGRTAAPIAFETMSAISSHKNFWAVKEASGSEEDFAKYAEAAPNAHMMSGDDLMLPAFSKLGAKGVVSVAANTWPAATHEYAKQCLSGEFTDNELWENACKALFAASNPIPSKAILADLGRIKSNVTRAPLSEKDMVEMDTIRSIDEQINTWMAEQQ